MNNMGSHVNLTRQVTKRNGRVAEANGRIGSMEERVRRLDSVCGRSFPQTIRSEGTRRTSGQEPILLQTKSPPILPPSYIPHKQSSEPI